ncbi:hypothetical protein [Nocardia carnea]|uniref:hypothetical protein n=1 Tax=Nocardia carnea TaxID=37328 RepID=UPI002454901B|nr:hypothetical protein [Nocardia carnea]
MIPHRLTQAMREEWNRRHADCAADAGFGVLDEAFHVRTVHGRHGPECLQSLAADAYICAHAGDDYE